MSLPLDICSLYWTKTSLTLFERRTKINTEMPAPVYFTITKDKMSTWYWCTNGLDWVPESRELISKLFSYPPDLEVIQVEPQDIITEPHIYRLQIRQHHKKHWLSVAKFINYSFIQIYFTGSHKRAFNRKIFLPKCSLFSLIHNILAIFLQWFSGILWRNRLQQNIWSNISVSRDNKKA